MMRHRSSHGHPLDCTEIMLAALSHAPLEDYAFTWGIPAKFYGYVTKPVEFGELARVIAHTCGIVPNAKK
jgi:hypothetical protein